MTPPPWERLFDYRSAFNNPVTVGAVIGIGVVLAVSGASAWLLFRLNRISRKLYDEVILRWRAWLWLALMMLAPILLGPAWILVSVELNNVFALCVGEAIGGPKLLAHNSPGKNVAGFVGGLVLTTALVAVLGHEVFESTPV